MKKFICYSSFVGILLSSCGKEDSYEDRRTNPVEFSSQVTELDYEYHFFYDGETVDESAIDLEDTTKVILIETGLPDGSNDFLVRVHVFSSLSNYYDYGLTLNEDLELLDDIQNHLAISAEQMGVFEYIDANGQIPSWWQDFEASVIDSMYGNQQRSLRKSLTGNLRSECSGGRSLILYPLVGRPWLWSSGWDNRVSSFTPLFIGGVHFVYNRSFYRSRRGTIWTWGMAPVAFCGPLSSFNNRASSWLNFGL